MKKLYLFLSVMILFMTYGTLHSQVLVPENFENGVSITDFNGWTTDLPPFSVVQSDACEGSQSMRNNPSASNTNSSIQYLSQVATGNDIEVSFEYKIVDTGSGSFTTGNFGTIDLSYTTDDGQTWVIYDTIDQSDVPTTDCSTHTATISATDVPNGSDFGWKLEYTWANGDYYIYVDNFLAVEQVSCIQPINATFDETTITTSTIDISWEDINSPNSGEWEIAVCTFAGDPTGPPQNFSCPPSTYINYTDTSSTPSYQVDQLADGTSYYIYVRSVCGPSDTSAWTRVGPATGIQTIAEGATCDLAKVVSSLPYTDSDDMMVFGDDITGNPGGACGTTQNILSGYEAFYEYTPTTDDILTIDLSGFNNSNGVGVFVYESCADVGNICVAGGFSDDGTPITLSGVFVDQNEDYYIVVASIDGNGDPGDTPFTLDIEGFDCASWTPPSINASVDFVDGQTLDEFDNTPFGAQPEFPEATLTWYEDNAGVQGPQVSGSLSNVMLSDGDIYYVTQTIGTCESPAQQVTFNEFDCDTDLVGITNTQNDFVCESGSITLSATSANPDNIYWYDAATGGEVVQIGDTFTTPDLSQTTSYWVSEAFVGASLIDNQAKPGPLSISTSTSTDYGVEFDVVEPLTIVEVDVYAAGSGTITIQLQDGSGNPTGQEVVWSLNPGTSANPQLNVIPLNFDIQTPGTYRLARSSGSVPLLYSLSADTNFPYAIANSGEVTSGHTSFSTNSNYYYFYNWTVTGQTVLCETSRTQVDAVVEEIIPTTVSASETTVCVGEQVTLDVTSTNSDYSYNWEWMQAGTVMTDTGATIQVNPTANTTYTVTATDNVTNCEFVNDIEIITRGLGDLPLYPDGADICLGETIALNSGGIVFDFESQQQITNWNTVNNSTTTVSSLNPASADWRVVDSPYNLDAQGVASNDSSQFFISIADSLGPGASLDSQLISPSIDLVGVASAQLEFYHYFKPYFSTFTNQTTTAKVSVSVDQGQWQEIRHYDDEVDTVDTGKPRDFEYQSFDLTDYVGSDDVRIRFQHAGGWGWYWAVDNVIINRTYADGVVSWTPTTDLYFDEQATLPYDGSPAEQVYFNGSQSGQFTYTATLDILDCTNVATDVTINVTETLPPTGNANQEFAGGDVINDLVVSGNNLKWYRELPNGEYDRITINFPLSDGETYYVTQTENGCESEYFAVTVNFNCPIPTNLSVTVSANNDGVTADAIVSWDEPANTDGVVDYYVAIKDEDGNVVFESVVSADNGFEIFNGLDLDTDYTAEIYTICDGNSEDPVNSPTEIEDFNTSDLSYENPLFVELSYYPNPTESIVTINNANLIESLSVYDMQGRKVLAKSVDSKNVQVNLGEYASGVYFIKLTSDSVSKTIRIIRE